MRADDIAGSPQKYILTEMQRVEVGGGLQAQGLLATLERSSSKTWRGGCLVGFEEPLTPEMSITTPRLLPRTLLHSLAADSVIVPPGPLDRLLPAGQWRLSTRCCFRLLLLLPLHLG